MWVQHGVRMRWLELTLALGCVAAGCSERNPLLDRDHDAIFADPLREPMDAGTPSPIGPGPESPDARVPVGDATVAPGGTVVDGVCIERDIGCDAADCATLDVPPACPSAGGASLAAQGECGPFRVEYDPDEGYWFWSESGELIGRYRTGASARFCGGRAFAQVEGFVPNPELHCPDGPRYRCACNPAASDDLDAGGPDSPCDPGPLGAILKRSLFGVLGR